MPKTRSKTKKEEINLERVEPAVKFDGSGNGTA